MSRSGYSDDYENVGLYRQAVHRAITGRRGQAFLHKLRDAIVLERGSREALDACTHRRVQAQINARRASLIALYGACASCGTPYENADDPCGKCDPSIDHAEGGIY